MTGWSSMSAEMLVIEYRVTELMEIKSDEAAVTNSNFGTKKVFGKNSPLNNIEQGLQQHEAVKDTQTLPRTVILAKRKTPRPCAGSEKQTELFNKPAKWSK